MNSVWNTKFGPRRVRHEPPTLDDALFAARGMTDDPQQQVEFAASLMEMPVEQVKAAMLKSGAKRKDVAQAGFTARAGSKRTVVVERKVVRRPVARRRSSG
jgi:hypothetical protein